METFNTSTKNVDVTLRGFVHGYKWKRLHLSNYVFLVLKRVRRILTNRLTLTLHIHLYKKKKVTSDTEKKREKEMCIWKIMDVMRVAWGNNPIEMTSIERTSKSVQPQLDIKNTKIVTMTWIISTVENTLSKISSANVFLTN